MTYNGQESDKLDREFNAEVIGTTFNSATVKWNLLRDAEVYKVEKHHKYKGWEKTGWTSTDNYVIHDLEENFGYLLRVQALKCDESKSHYAIINTSPEIVACTLADLPSTLALHRALKKSQQFLVKRLLRRRPNLIEYPGPNGYLPLCNAIAYGETCIADYLLTIGASVHIGNLDNKRTPLHVAFYYGRLSVARVLLNLKADMEARDIYGLTACHLAIDANQERLLKFALENGANVEARDACGWTLLMRSVVMNAGLSIFELLITYGANTKAQDMFDLTCLDLARLYGHTEAQEYFEKFCLLNSEDGKENEN
ncbi:receptor-interacting serine/threonine-protein kinase 4 [Glossina fuscipes]|uniref:Receptor-interacting serine/threonine-protein kinase 4 n=1 Tax=Glossina fuscipes TaxID=7396 RepID=A0A8U0WI38_9MUSC|nr:receptor-interacting serine/threonine-protein kinase 4 [Glossina fuscipes]KAI9584932.1 hypothetical protein GQX74_006827 [Glossina fuscipes]